MNSKLSRFFLILSFLFSIFSNAEQTPKKVTLKEIKSWSLEKLEDHQKTLKDENYFYGLGYVLDKAYETKNWKKVAYFANLNLQEAEKYKQDWNYGNAIYYSNLALSEMAYIEGDKVKARNYLIKASQTPGSPQLNSFGPFNSSFNKYLVYLAQNGEKESLVQFAKNCRNFLNTKSDIKMSEKDKRNEDEVTQSNLLSIERFIKQIESGQTPDFKKSDS